MLKKDFWYDLPKELIAQEPAAPRDAARLMVLDRQNDSIVHSVFHDLPQLNLLTSTYSGTDCPTAKIASRTSSSEIDFSCV